LAERGAIGSRATSFTEGFALNDSSRSPGTSVREDGASNVNPVPDTPSFQIIASIAGVDHTFVCRSDQTVLAAAEEAGVPLPSSCCSGVCTTCAALLSDGEVHQPDAMGVKAELQQQGYALLCVAYPCSDLKLRAGMEDALYEAQFGQYQK
jgi:ferredoxin